MLEDGDMEGNWVGEALGDDDDGDIEGEREGMLVKGFLDG